MADKLVVEENCDGFFVCWECDGELGLELGPVTVDLRGSLRGRDVADTCAASQAIQEGICNGSIPPALDGSNYCWLWETSVDAKKALRAAKAAIKAATSSVPWPDWARKALAAGWKPPRGWKPSR